jgi:hypothetical protein
MFTKLFCHIKKKKIFLPFFFFFFFFPSFSSSFFRFRFFRRAAVNFINVFRAHFSYESSFKARLYAAENSYVKP